MSRSALPFSFTRRCRPTVPPAPSRLKTSMAVGDLLVLHHLGDGAGGRVVAAAGGVGDHEPQAADRAVVAAAEAEPPSAVVPQPVSTSPAATAPTVSFRREAVRIVFLLCVRRVPAD